MNSKVKKTYTIKELIENCISKRIENTPEYRKSVHESNEQIKKYYQRQAKVYAEAENFIANTNTAEFNNNAEKNLIKKLKK